MTAEPWERLRRAGWRMEEQARAGRWLVTGINGIRTIHAEGLTREDAWRQAGGQLRMAALPPNYWRGRNLCRPRWVLLWRDRLTLTAALALGGGLLLILSFLLWAARVESRIEPMHEVSAPRGGGDDDW